MEGGIINDLERLNEALLLAKSNEFLFEPTDMWELAYSYTNWPASKYFDQTTIHYPELSDRNVIKSYSSLDIRASVDMAAEKMHNDIEGFVKKNNYYQTAYYFSSTFGPICSITGLKVPFEEVIKARIDYINSLSKPLKVSTPKSKEEALSLIDELKKEFKI